MTNRQPRVLIPVGFSLLALWFASCGGDEAKVGDCIDADQKVVECSSESATAKLVSDQDRSDAIACIAIGDKPQERVEVGDGTFCAEEQ